MRIGWDRAWITRTDIANYAVARLQSAEADNSTAVISLTRSEDMNDELIRGLLTQLAEHQTTNGGSGLDKWRLGHLVHLDTSDLTWDQKVTRLEEIGAEFRYPPDMRLCTRYSPSQAAINAGCASPDDRSIDPLDAMRSLIKDLKQRLFDAGGNYVKSF